MEILADAILELHLADGVAGSSYLFAIFLRGTSTEVGRILLRVDHEDRGLVDFAGHIGFEISPAYRGHRYAARACRLLAPLARRHGFTELWLTTSPKNHAARRALERLGARHVDTVPVPPDSDMRRLGLRNVRRYCWLLA